MAPRFEVTGPVVVLPTSDGSERYMYKGALIGEGFTEAGIKHALSIGLITEFDEPEAEKPSGDEKPADSWNHDRIDAWAAAQEPAVVFTGENPTKAQKLEQIAALSK